MMSPTYNSQSEHLTDLGTGGDLALEVTSISGIGEFQLESILSSSNEWK